MSGWDILTEREVLLATRHLVTETVFAGADAGDAPLLFGKVPTPNVEALREIMNEARNRTQQIMACGPVETVPATAWIVERTITGKSELISVHATEDGACARALVERGKIGQLLWPEIGWRRVEVLQ